ncbi:MAG TPA: DUF433 domain-containing protein [Bryobacteraceae bacterium]|jgi:uncharacterized protein (DUF433 family)
MKSERAHGTASASAEGSTADEIEASYPSLSLQHIGAALAYAAEFAHEEHLAPIRSK